VTDSALKGLFGGGDDKGDDTPRDSSSDQGGDVRQSTGNTALEGLFGGGGDDDEPKRNARDFINRYEDGNPAEGYSDDEARGYLKQAMQQASPEQIERASAKAMSRMNEDQRREFSEMLQQRQAGGVERSEGGGGGGMGDLGGMLGGLLGGGGGGGGGLGGMLGGLLGGGGGGGGSVVDNMDNDNTKRSGGGDAGGMLGGIMGSTAGKAAVAGLAAYLMKELLDKKG